MLLKSTLEPTSNQSLPPDPFANDPWSLFFVIFRPLSDFPGYAVDSNGDLWSCLRSGPGTGRSSEWKKCVYGSTSSNGRIIVGLWINGKKTSKQLHRLIMGAFIGPCPIGKEVCHNNGDHTDNRLSNLRYDTRAGNDADKDIHGTRLRGDRHPVAKLDAEKVRQIKILLASGKETHRSIASRFGVDRAIVTRIRDGKAWKWVS